MRARPLLALSVLACLALARTAQAQSVGLDLSGCSEPPERDVRILAALELRGRLVEQTSSQAALEIVVRCSGARANLTTEPPREPREIDLATVPAELRARLLALAIAELSRAPGTSATQAESESPSAAPLPPMPAPRAETVRPQVRISTLPALRFRGLALAGLNLQAAPTWGILGSLSTLVRLIGPLSWTGALSLGQARREIDRGRLRLRSASLRSGPALVLERPHALLYGGLAARLTLLALTGQPSDRATTSAAGFRTWLLGPELFVGVSLPLARRVVLALEAQLAQQLRELRVDVVGGQGTTLSSWSASLGILLGTQW